MKIKNLSVTLLIPILLFSQNIQIHYDLLREHFTTTFEGIFFDNYGYTFGFVDIDYNNRVDRFKNASLAYYEIARYFLVKGGDDLYFTFQYNDGLTNRFSFNPVWLTGLQYKVMGLPMDFLFRKEIGTDGLTIQLTVVWFYEIKRFNISGYIDIWNTGNGYPKGRIAFMSEPQFWYKLTPNIYIGGEIEISVNFSGAWSVKREFKEGEIFLLPTFGIKWNL
ncbi:MAG: DUF5020 family protein [Candidatus Marinimicrobia bacterium]|nr:DUF5020 family protein [Candidatus Neomarinimicrobiota bacterium]